MRTISHSDIPNGILGRPGRDNLLSEALPNANFAVVVSHFFKSPYLQHIIIGAGEVELARGTVQDILEIRQKTHEIDRIYKFYAASKFGTFTVDGEQLLTNIIGLRTIFTEMSSHEHWLQVPIEVRMYEPQM